MIKKKILLVSILLLAFGCSSTIVQVAQIKIKGSETMLALTKRLAKEYSRLNPGISILVEGGGSATGFQSLIRNEIDICTSSRVIEPEEAKILAESFGTVGVSTFIAKDIVCVYVNKKNPVNQLKLETVKNIFNGGIKNWKELGWYDKAIHTIIRNDNSGTALYFDDIVLKHEPFINSSKVVNTLQSLFEEIEDDEYAIGFGGLVEKNNCKILAIDDFDPSKEAETNKNYPLVRYLHFYTRNQTDGIVKNFINWVLSEKGQEIVKESGFIPLYNSAF